MRSELKDFAVFQEEILRGHDPSKGPNGWKNLTAQALASRLVEELGEAISHLFGNDQVLDFLIASIRDHIEESSIDIDFNPRVFRSELADVANFCMMLHDVSNRISNKKEERKPALA